MPNEDNQEIKVLGKTIDDQTRCVHYHSETDVIAIKFRCCGEYYPCYECHEEEAGHAAETWKKEAWDNKAILCGACRHELSIREYMQSENRCPFCDALFNPGCKNHHHLYFDV